MHPVNLPWNQPGKNIFIPITEVSPKSATNAIIDSYLPINDLRKIPMNIHQKNIIVYILLVILPFLLGTGYFYHDLLKKDTQVRKEKAEWIGTIHQQSWDEFITQTNTSLDIVSLSAKINSGSPQKNEPLLRDIQQRDSRYGGLYLLDSAGIKLVGSNLLPDSYLLANKDYIKELIQTRDTVISNHPEYISNHQEIIGLASPVLDNKGELSAILVAYLRIDYLKNLMKLVTPDAKLYIANADQDPILKINIDKDSKLTGTDWLVKPINRLPWSIHVQLPAPDYSTIIKTLIKNLLFLLIISHVFYLLIKYLLLKRQTEKERLQYEAQKLELVGTLAASTAHEIRNPLTGIKGLLQLLGEKYKDADDQYYFQVIDTELQRINEIASEFLILGKPTAQNREIIDLSAIVNELQPLVISEGNSYSSVCSWEVPPEPIRIEGIKDQIKQVLLNLSKNSFESMKIGGTLTIRLYKTKQQAKLEIADTGEGIQKKDLEKIFHPFYTSKDTGTGLGLVICKRIIESMGGTISIESTLSVGTTVFISLPLQH